MSMYNAMAGHATILGIINRVDCAYPLDATLAEIQAINPAVDALPVMSNINQAGTLTILSGRATDWETATAPTTTAPGPRTVNFGTGVKKIEWDYAMPDMGGVNGAVGWMYLSTYYNDLTSGIVSLYVRSTVTSGVQLTELRVFRLGVAVTGFITVTRTGRLAVTMNSTTGTFSVESSAGVATLSANTYTTTTPCIFVLNLNEATGVAAAQAGKTMSATLITNGALMTYAAASGVTDIDGNAL